MSPFILERGTLSETKKEEDEKRERKMKERRTKKEENWHKICVLLPILLVLKDYFLFKLKKK